MLPRRRRQAEVVGGVVVVVASLPALRIESPDAHAASVMSAPAAASRAMRRVRAVSGVIDLTSCWLLTGSSSQPVNP